MIRRHEPRTLGQSKGNGNPITPFGTRTNPRSRHGRRKLRASTHYSRHNHPFTPIGRSLEQPRGARGGAAEDTPGVSREAPGHHRLWGHHRVPRGAGLDRQLPRRGLVVARRRRDRRGRDQLWLPLGELLLAAPGARVTWFAGRWRREGQYGAL